MSPRYERLLFRLGLVGLVVAMAVFGYRVFVNPPGPNQVGTRATTTTAAVDGTSSTAPAPSSTAVPPPAFTVTSPLDRTVVNSDDLVVIGIGAPGAVVNIGDIATFVGANGVWSLRLTLEQDENLLTFTQTTADEVEAQTSIVVTYERV